MKTKLKIFCPQVYQIIGFQNEWVSLDINGVLCPCSDKIHPLLTQVWVNLSYLFLGSYFAIVLDQSKLDQFVLEEIRKNNFMNQIVFLENLSNKLQ